MEATITRNKSVADGLDALIAGGSLVGKIGWTGSDIHVDPDTGGIQLVAITALQNEFGSFRIPSRPFLRNTIRESSTQWLEKMEDDSRRVLDNSFGFDTVLENVTQLAVSDVRTTVQNRVLPQLSPYTLFRRREHGRTGDIPLYDTGHMMQTLTNEVIAE